MHDDDLRQDIAENLERFRKERGWSQDALAALAGKAERTIQRGKGSWLSLRTLSALAGALGVHLHELVRPAPKNLLRRFFLSFESDPQRQRALAQLAARAPGPEYHEKITQIVGSSEIARTLYPFFLDRWEQYGGTRADFPIDLDESLVWDMTEGAARFYYEALRSRGAHVHRQP